ncbi:MAG TPA: ABC transporter permease [Candidatus Dormibacteraeota bacterium]|nr:ABC transporter permease [Candidatus Dormibacteraeota bacterium]
MQATDSRNNPVVQLGDGLRNIFAKTGALPFLLVILVVVFQLANSRFLGRQNMVDMLHEGVFLALASLGQMFILVSGGFDLSIGSNIALTSISSASVMAAVYGAHPGAAGLAIAAGAATAVVVGLVVGLVNGVGVAVLGVNPFIVTLATASAFQGITLLISQGQEVGGLPNAFIMGVGSGSWLGLPIAGWVTLPLVLGLYVLLAWSRYGRYIFAIGSNAAAARVAGVRVGLQVLATYVICAVATAIAGFLLTARVSAGEPLLGAEYTLQSITAAVIGGASLRGGQGSIGGTLLGVVFVIFLADGMDLMRLGSNHEMIALGLALIFAVVADRQRAKAVAAGYQKRLISQSDPATEG